MSDHPAVPDDLRDGLPLTPREAKILREAEHQLTTVWPLGGLVETDHSRGSRIDPPAVLIGGLIILLIGAFALSVPVVIVGVALCLGALVAATR